MSPGRSDARAVLLLSVIHCKLTDSSSADWEICKTGHGRNGGKGVAGTNQIQEGSYPEQILPRYWERNQPT